MKQRITVDQLNELSDEQKEKLREWWVPEIGDLMLTGSPFSTSCEYLMGAFDSEHIKKNNLPVLSIGQMIEFLDYDLEVNINYPKKTFWEVNISTRVSHETKWMDKNGEEYFDKWFNDIELCDAIWEAVKATLD